MIRSKAIHTTKWGTACTQCASAKAKCSRQSGSLGSKCDRCERLLKQCTDQVHRPRKTRSSSKPIQRAKNTQPHAGSQSPLARELTLDTSCSALFEGGGTSMSGTSQDHPFVVRHSPAFGQCNAENNFVPVPETYLSYAPPRCHGQPQSPICPGPVDSDDSLLAIFRNELMPQYPFVIIPFHVQAEKLQARTPFLMSCIRMVASFRSLESMRGQMFRIMSYISDHMFLRAERSLDLLMGIVVILGWYHYHCLRHSQLNNLLCLAESLVADLGLNRSPVPQDAESEAERPTEQKRLLLGVWYLRSSAAVHFQQLNSMPFTPYMRRCLADLEEENESGLDSLLVYFVKIQHLSESVVTLSSSCEGTDNDETAGDEYIQSNTRPQLAPTIAMMSASQDEIERVAEILPQNLKANALIQTHLNTASLCLHKPLLSNSPRRATPTADSSSLVTSSIKIWFESWLSSIPASKYYSLPTPIIFQLIYSVTTLFKWAKLAVPRPLDIESSSSCDLLSPHSQATSRGIASSSAASSPSPAHNILAWETSKGNTEASPDWVSTLGLTGFEMVEFLVSISERCSEASGLISSSAINPESWNNNNFWGVNEKKAREQAEQLPRWADWAEMMSAAQTTATYSSASGSPSPLPSLYSGHGEEHLTSQAGSSTNTPAPLDMDVSAETQFDYNRGYEYEYQTQQHRGSASKGMGNINASAGFLTPPAGPAPTSVPHRQVQHSGHGHGQAPWGVAAPNWAGDMALWHAAAAGSPGHQDMVGADNVDPQLWFETTTTGSQQTSHDQQIQGDWDGSQMGIETLTPRHPDFPMSYRGPP
ncbi:hypothetical protein B0H63DRAFT_564083 [Podospora didyma]|uniref:Zn(2)-C6 fungal-type domain-containing protein n=1 Tax=Podospora didyma TaxID=330526 RepID=A0AAE0K9N8_9PEZI|nr:hypothetical protein B0H63DRAFT_564083 [Podospora didyma]